MPAWQQNLAATVSTKRLWTHESRYGGGEYNGAGSAAADGLISATRLTAGDYRE